MSDINIDLKEFIDNRKWKSILGMYVIPVEDVYLLLKYLGYEVKKDESYKKAGS